MIHAIVFIVAAVAAPSLADAAQRSYAAKAEFKRQQPCPATGNPKGSCPGYVIDHVIPLCAGGRDHPDNMQWQTVSDAKVKDREEQRTCALQKKLGRKSEDI